jgi:hypothetical protein
MALAVAGCAVTSEQKDDLLADAGFTRAKADSPQWAAAVRSIPPHRFVHRTVNGQRMVFWYDPVGCRCVYSGTEANFATYRSLHSQEARAFDEGVSMPSPMAQ